MGIGINRLSLLLASVACFGVIRRNAARYSVSFFVIIFSYSSVILPDFAGICNCDVIII
jgi:hypothetical protein